VHKATALILRLLAALSLIAAVTFVFAWVIPVNATTVGFFYLVAILAIAASWGFVESATASVAETAR